MPILQSYKYIEHIWAKYIISKFIIALEILANVQ